MPRELQLQILGEFRGLPQEVMHTDLEHFGKLKRGAKTLHRFRLGEYRVYFERHPLGVIARIGPPFSIPRKRFFHAGCIPRSWGDR